MTTYIAVAPKIASSYQLLSLISYVRHNKHRIKTTYVYVDPYWHTKQIPSRYLNLCEEFNVNLVDEINVLPSAQAVHKSGYKLLRFFVNNVSLKSILTCRQDRAVLIADGLGTYISYAAKINAIVRERGNPTLNERRKIFNYMLMSKVAERFPSVHSYMIFDKNSLNLDDDFCCQLGELLTKICVKKSAFNNHSIFISQPLVQLGVLSESRYVEILKALKQRASVEKKKFIVKPHPAENPKWYSDNEFEILKFDGVIEEFAVNNPDNEFISFLSSALLTLPYLTDSKVYRLPLPEFEHNLVLSRAQINLLNQVKKVTLENFND